MSEVLLSFRGRQIRPADVAFLRELIAQNPGLSRRRLSVKVCQAWNWIQPNGQTRDMVCRGLMLALHRAGQIELPAKRSSPLNNAIRHRRVSEVEPIDTTPVEVSLASLGPLEIRLVRRAEGEKLFAHLLSRHHYLGYTRPVGEHLKYLILPWVKVPHLASHLLGRIARRISADWQALYHHPIHLLESFVDRERFRGTCYRAANWTAVGRSVGRGTKARSGKPTCSIKELWVYPLGRQFRQRLLQRP
jgi:hypothetical protein